MLSWLIIGCFQILFSCILAIESSARCRNEKQVHLPFDAYHRDACARCYKYMPHYAFHFKFQYIEKSGSLYDPISNVTHSTESSNFTDALLQSFAEDSFAEKWKSCCRSAVNCCHTMAKDPLLNIGGMYCPRTWDGWQCWPDTPAGSVATQPCAEHIYFENGPPSCTRYAHKECLANGTWYTNQHLKEWTNYTTCGRREEHSRFVNFRIATHVISIVFIIPALTIFISYKQLQVPRITMHRHLLLSLLLKAASSTLFDALVIGDELRRTGHLYQSIIATNGAGCKLLFILTKYFRMTNYMWMFCEGFYLQKLIAATFNEQRNLLIFYIIGWGLPVVPVGMYAILRKTLDDERCWAMPVEMFEWIMNVPNLLSLLLNLCFLCNIIRVLVTKLKATHAKEPSQYRKAVRATLVLIPLFGLHFCLVIYKPYSGRCGFLQAYIYFSYAMDGLQGFMVALIFCYMNGEVLYLVKRSYQRLKLNQQFRSRKNSALMRRWSTTMTSTNDSHNHNYHQRTKSMDAKPKETSQPTKMEAKDGVN